MDFSSLGDEELALVASSLLCAEHLLLHPNALPMAWVVLDRLEMETKLTFKTLSLEANRELTQRKAKAREEHDRRSYEAEVAQRSVG